MLDGNCSTRPPGRTNSTARTNSTDWQRPDPAAISDLYDLGATFVLTSPSRPKVPIWKQWQAPRDRPSPEIVNAYTAAGGPIGLIPNSIREAVADFDHGGRERILAYVEAHPPRLFVPTKTPDHFDGYYDARAERRDSQFEVDGVSGEIKTSGLVVLWGDTCDRLAAAMRRGGAYWFPTDLFDAAGLPPAREPARGPRVRIDAVPVAGGVKGDRNVSMFNAVRQWAYRHVLDFADLDTFHGAIRDRCERYNAGRIAPIGTLPDDRASDVWDTAWSVASWTWNRREALARGRRPLDIDPVVLDAMRRKGGAMRARNVRAFNLRIYREIADHYTRSGSLRATGERFGISFKHVARIVERILPVAEVEHVRCAPRRRR